MPPPMISLSTLATRLVSTRDLGRNLGAADHGGHRPLGLVEHAAQRVDFLHQQRAGIGGQQARDGLRGGMRAVRGRESIVDEDVAESRQALGERGSFFSSPLWKRRFSSTAICPGCSAATAVLRRLADAVGANATGLAQQLGQLVRDRLQAELRIGPALGPAEMGDDDRPCAPRLARSSRPGTSRSSRVASVTLPSLTGTLRSARTSTRLPLTSMAGGRS